MGRRTEASGRLFIVGSSRVRVRVRVRVLYFLQFLFVSSRVLGSSPVVGSECPPSATYLSLRFLYWVLRSSPVEGNRVVFADMASQECERFSIPPSFKVEGSYHADYLFGRMSSSG